MYAASHRNGQRAAIKILHRHCAQDSALVERFVREGYLANAIKHPGVVSMIDDNVAEDGSVYLVMELLEGIALDKRARQSPLPPAEVLKIADQVLDVLVSAHAAGIIHRDIKPANLFLLHDGRLKLLDFGIARLGETTLEAGATQQGTWMGTPSFMAPEQARARWKQVDARSDLFAVGATMISLLSGVRPRAADNANEELLLAMTKPLPSLAEYVPGADPALVALVDRAVAFDREDRWADAAAMRNALRALQPIDPATKWMSGTMRATVGSFDDITIVTPPPSIEIEEGPVEEAASMTAAPGSMTDLPTVPPPDFTEGAMMRSNAPPPPMGRRSRVASVLAMMVIGVLVGAGLVAVKVRHDMSRAATQAPPPVAMPLPVPVMSSGPGLAAVPDVTPSPSASTTPTPPRRMRVIPVTPSPSASAVPIDTSHAIDERY